MTFFEDADFELYKQLIVYWCKRMEVEIWSYCLMPNHVHLVLTPSSESSLAAAVGEAHRRYTRAINQRENWQGYLWQGRFASFPMDEGYLLRAVRYILLNPVRAGLTQRAEDWPYSSARAHLAVRADGFVDVDPMRRRVADWSSFLRHDLAEEDKALLELHQRTGRPLGTADFLERLEEAAGRRLRPGKPGPKPRVELSTAAGQLLPCCSATEPA